MKLLVVEDDEFGIELLTRALSDLGHEAVVARDGVEAWGLLTRERLRVVVADWHLPRLDGLQLCQRIRAASPHYVYFILHTGAELTNANYDEAFAKGVDDCLSKHADRRELRVRLHVAERVLRVTREAERMAALLPICSHCKRIRDDQNYWQQIEEYLTKRDGVRFSHGICPECYTRVTVPAFNKMGWPAPPYPTTRPR